MASFLMSCSEDGHAVEREWLLQLVAAGMQGALDADICRFSSPSSSITTTYPTKHRGVWCQTDLRLLIPRSLPPTISS
jgi:hypothetical protein